MTVEQAKDAMRKGHTIMAEAHVWQQASHELRVEAERTVALLDQVLFQQLLQHPLPWHVESDWTEEVRSPGGYCIAKCRTTEDAEVIIQRAEGMSASSALGETRNTTDDPR